MRRFSQPMQAEHTVHIGGPPHATHASNKIKTSLYTILNFVPLNLFKQFHRVANVWFFLICCLQTIKSISVTDGKPSTALGLVFVMFVTMVKDAIEDISRHKADGVENGRAAHRRNPQSAGECPWQEVQTGDLIVVRNREFIPADLVLLATSNDQGQCHVMTANLDGETNLKLRQVASGLLTHQPAFVPDANVARAREPAGALQVLGSILCESPNKHLSRFDGTFVAEGGEKLPLGPNNVVLRGTMLRNTSWALGVAVYTGRQTKIQQNAAQPPFKMSRLGKIVDRTLLFVFLSEIFFCLLAYGIGRSWWSRAFNFFEPLGGVGRDAEWDGFLRFMTYVLVFTNYIPISLLVTQDMVKFAQAFFMNWDLRMYYERTDTPAKVRCADLNEELGMIDHIFSDKTGTLTCNVMAYRKCSISGKSYGESVQAGQSFTDPHVLFDDDSLKRVLTDSGYRGIVADFWTNLMLNHTVQAEYPHAQGQGQERGAPVYSAASPDELAFVRAAAHQGFVFEANAPKALICKVDGRPVTYDVLHVLEFNSDRKRSSVVARERHEGSDANGNTMRSSIKLLTKGADNVIIPLLHADFTTPGGAKTRLLDQTNADILRYSKDGLRTLMITTRTVPDDFYEQWSKRYHEAETAVQGRRQKMERIMAEMERDLELVGATAIEDKLQDGVVQTISALRNAGIKIWVLTGDKVDTAISISMSAALLTEKMHILRLVGQDGGMDSDSHGVPTADALKGEFAKFELETANHAKDKVYALVADSLALEAIDREHMGNELMSVCAKCKSVVCARVTPDQKGMIVRLAQDTDARPVTLAIGDGANDVNMIQKAHIGVGIAGEEGLQAVNNSDYAIAQFRFLANLVIVHGRWSVRRMVELTYYMFFKNTLLVLPQFYFGAVSLFSGQPVYTDMLYQVYNMFLTAFPVIVFGILDQDISYSASFENPQVFKLKEAFFTTKNFWISQGLGVIHAGLIFIVVAMAFGNGIWDQDGKVTDMYGMGTTINLCVCVNATIRICMVTRTWTWIFSFFVLLSLVLWWVWMIFLSTPLDGSFTHPRTEVYHQIYDLPTQAAFWLAILLSAVVFFIPYFAAEAYAALFKPQSHHILREMARLEFSPAGAGAVQQASRAIRPVHQIPQQQSEV